MRYHEFIRHVRERMDLDSADDAATAIRATLSTLGECLYRTERRHLASQLPKEAAGFLDEHVDSEATRLPTGCFTLEEFYDRVAARADVSRRGGVERATAVVAVLNDVLPEGEWEHIVEELPEPYLELMGERTARPGSPTRA